MFFNPVIKQTGCKVEKTKQTYTRINSFTQWRCNVRHYQTWHAALIITAVILETTGNSKANASPGYPTLEQLVNVTTTQMIKASARQGRRLTGRPWCWHPVIDGISLRAKQPLSQRLCCRNAALAGVKLVRTDTFMRQKKYHRKKPRTRQASRSHTGGTSTS